MIQSKNIRLLIVLFLSFSGFLFLVNPTAMAVITPPQPPLILVMSPTYNVNYSGSVPLTFILPTNGTVDIPFSYEGGPGSNGKGVWGIKKYSYSLDGHSNVSVAGNTTLNALPDGKHQLTVFANRWVYYGIYYGGFEDTVASSEISFSVHQPPENQMCNTNDLPLNAKLPHPLNG
jgi:hypothetical protein